MPYIAALILMLATPEAPSILPNQSPQYVFVNIAAGAGRVRSETQEAFQERLEEVAERLRIDGPSSVAVGVSYIFSVLEQSEAEMAARLQDLLRASEAADVPVLITLDGQNWWESRPDLWNWWDPDQPGYDPENAHNVEWTGWDPSSAVKLGWRNWGRQIRVAPAQNIASPRVLEATLGPVRTLSAVVAQWQAGLPPERRHLCGGLKLGWETGIGYNAFYYRDGNRYLDSDPADDPMGGLDTSMGLSGDPARTVPLGYAAVRTAGIREQGVVTREDLGEVTRRYLEALAKTAVEAGMPRDRVYVHQGGTYAPFDRHLPFSAAFNAWSTPGWSFYGVDPADTPLELEMAAAGRTRWAAAEWWWPSADAEGWARNILSCLTFQDCRYVCIYNWDQGGLSAHEAGIRAVHEIQARFGR